MLYSAPHPLFGCCSGGGTLPPLPRPPVMSAYDEEQEMSLDMLNDEFDHYSKSTAIAARPPRATTTTDIYLHTNSSATPRSNGKHSNGHGGGGGVRNGKPPAPPPPATTTKNGRVNGSATPSTPTSNGPLITNSLDRSTRHLYDNHGFEMQATEI